MNNYIIATSSTADLPKSFTNEPDLFFLPYTFTINGHDYEDDFGKSIPFSEFYKSVREGAMPSTSMVNVERYEEFFSSVLKQGKDLVYVEFSSALSGSCEVAISTAKKLNAQYENQVYVVDSLCASMGQGLYVFYALEQKKKGLSAKELSDWLTNNRQNLVHWFTVDDLNHLKRGGRLSSASAFFGTMLKIKPVLHVDECGRLVPCYKVRGRKKALEKMLELMREDILQPEGQTVYISHGDALEDAEKLKEMIVEAFPTIKEIVIHFIGPVIGAHSGPGTVALFYWGKNRS